MGKRKRNSKGTKHLGPPILTTINTPDETDDDFIFPAFYKGKLITRERYKELASKTRNHKGNVDDLVYKPSQAPSKRSNKGWKHVIRAPRDETRDDWHKRSLFRIDTKNDGHIIIQFCQTDVHQNIRNYVDDILEHHTPVREETHESGKMVGAGLRYEARSARIRRYAHANGTAEVSPTERDGLIAFHNLLQNPSNDVLYRDKTFRDDYLGTLDNEKAGSLKLPLGDCEEISVLPTIAASESLNNSLHRDVNDASRCFAVFYQKERVGKSFLVFPGYSLAIECWQSPVLVSWDGRCQQHCTITCRDGIQSLFGVFNQNVKKTQGIYRQFSCPQKRRKKGLEVGMEVNVETHVETDELHLFDPIYGGEKPYNASQYVIRRGKIIRVMGDGMLVIQYLGGMRDLGEITLPDTMVIPAP